ncbi:uncharacterized protein ColSpa_01311 [Colletotrichum spaethianum]|uniref:Uncharacterized protein n=1 Tax=Colletotrichum spaethianum TaxID=700344 RepID=A0AA37L6M7_9PEZI|nr:uncharacterized protein ColSpa_01311 [Colletotrichum spaethianum]GKT41130.1 hypothetical protein ColSpa_01311 [Colletotrichum spaethianum]
MPLVKATAHPAGFIRVLGVDKGEKSPLKPSGAGIKKLTHNSTISSYKPPANLNSTKPASSTNISSSGSSASTSKTAEAPRVKMPAKAPKQTKKITNILGRTRRTKKLLSAASLPGLVPISSFGSRASALRASLVPPPQEDSSKIRSKSGHHSLGPQ